MLFLGCSEEEKVKMKVNREYKQVYVYIATYSIILFLIVVTHGRIYRRVTKSWKTCNWCFNKFPEEGTQIEEFWLCDEHPPDKIYFEIKLYYPGNMKKGYEVSGKIREEIYQMIKARQ